MGIIGVLWTTWGIWLQSTFIKENPFARWPVFFKIGFHYCQLKIKKHLSNEHLCFPAWALHHKCPFRHYDSAHTAADCGVCYSWGRMGTKIRLSCSHWWVVCVNRQEHGRDALSHPHPQRRSESRILAYMPMISHDIQNQLLHFLHTSWSLDKSLQDTARIKSTSQPIDLILGI